MSNHSKAKRAASRADKQREHEARLKNDMRVMRAWKAETDDMNTKRKVKQGRVHMQETAHGKLHDGRKLKNLANNPHGRIGKDYPDAETVYGQAFDKNGRKVAITADVVARSKPQLREAFGDCVHDLNMSRVHFKGEGNEKNTRNARESHNRAYTDTEQTYWATNPNVKK
jgi:hypothetical protein